MEIAMLIIGIILLAFAVFLIVAVLMQQGKSHNLSGAIAGGAETFPGTPVNPKINNWCKSQPAQYGPKKPKSCKCKAPLRCAVAISAG